ncbi:MAG: PilZ domain-containing protein [Stellaceae bacterium]
MVDFSTTGADLTAPQGQVSRRNAKRTGVLWPAQLEAADVKLPCVVLDISTAGAKLRSTDPLAGNLNKFRLTIDSLGAFDCTHVWEAAGRVGLRFIGSFPTKGEIENLITDPPYLYA